MAQIIALLTGFLTNLSLCCGWYTYYTNHTCYRP